MSFHLRDRVKPSDAADLKAIVTACGNFDAHELEYVPEILGELTARGEQASGFRLLVAEDESGPTAFSIYGPMDEDDSQFDLYWIATDPRVQHRGAGRLLLEETERRAIAEGATHMFIETEAGPAYAAAHRLYEGQGFAPVETMPDHYGPGRNRLIFAKALVPGLAAA
jgi:GNAT superfamily N-acetyltransferase